MSWHVPPEVDAPSLRRRGVPQRPQRETKLSHPGVLDDANLHFPAGVPLGAGLAKVADLCVVLDAGRVGAEDEPVLQIVERIEHHLKRVLLIQIRVASRIGRHNLRRIAIVQHHPYVHRIVVIYDAYFCLLGGRPFPRTDPPERSR